jgi:hypothetical protein
MRDIIGLVLERSENLSEAREFLTEFGIYRPANVTINVAERENFDLVPVALLKDARSPVNRGYKMWTRSERSTFRGLWKRGYSLSQIGRIMGRSTAAIGSRRAIEGLKPRWKWNTRAR